MAIDKVKEFFRERGIADHIMEFDASSATVELAAQALGCVPARIAKTLSFVRGDRPVLIVTAGDVRVDNAKYKARFGCKAKMLTPEEVLRYTGHAVGGVCPFGIPSEVEVYLDRSLTRFETVFPACGSSNSAIELTIPQLEEYSGNIEFVDVGK
jgi:prolyl-tRNA editing enzyme YbaK/EbsC (Cys-tRNA(Pro) deacylase)